MDACNDGWEEHPDISAFTHWKEHDAYKTAFNRLLRDLKANAAPKKLNKASV